MSQITRSVTATVDAAPEVVWALLSDPTRYGEISPENESAEWLSGEPGAVGSRFKGRNRRGKATWSTTCEVVESEPGRAFAFVVGKPAKPATTWRYDLVPDGDRTRVTETFVLPGPIGLGSRLVTRLTLGVRDREADLVAGMEATLQRLQTVARDADGARPA